MLIDVLPKLVSISNHSNATGGQFLFGGLFLHPVFTAAPRNTVASDTPLDQHTCATACVSHEQVGGLM